MGGVVGGRCFIRDVFFWEVFFGVVFLGGEGRRGGCFLGKRKCFLGERVGEEGRERGVAGGVFGGRRGVLWRWEVLFLGGGERRAGFFGEERDSFFFWRGERFFFGIFFFLEGCFGGEGGVLFGGVFFGWREGERRRGLEFFFFFLWEVVSGGVLWEGKGGRS